MWSSCLLGASFAAGAVAQPGQFQAYLVAHTLAHGWRCTLPVALAPVVSDIPVIVLVLTVLTRVPPLVVPLLQCVGGIFVIYLAARSLVSRPGRVTAEAAPPPARQSFVAAVAVNLLNPNPYLAWALVLGPVLIRAWHDAPAHGVAFLAAFYSVMVAATALLILAVAAARRMAPRAVHSLLAMSAVVLAAFGVYLVVNGVSTLLRT